MFSLRSQTVRVSLRELYSAILAELSTIESMPLLSFCPLDREP